MPDTLSRVAAEIHAQTGWTGKQLEEAAIAAAYIAALMAGNDRAADYFGDRYAAIAQAEG